MLTILLWLHCAVGTVYKGFWKKELFYAPGLEGWVYDDPGDGKRQKRPGEAQKVKKRPTSGKDAASEKNNQLLWKLLYR